MHLFCQKDLKKILALNNDDKRYGYTQEDAIMSYQLLVEYYGVLDHKKLSIKK